MDVLVRAGSVSQSWPLAIIPVAHDLDPGAPVLPTLALYTWTFPDTKTPNSYNYYVSFTWLSCVMGQRHEVTKGLG